MTWLARLHGALRELFHPAQSVTLVVVTVLLASFSAFVATLTALIRATIHPSAAMQSMVDLSTLLTVLVLSAFVPLVCLLGATLICLRLWQSVRQALSATSAEPYHEAHGGLSSTTDENEMATADAADATDATDATDAPARERLTVLPRSHRTQEKRIGSQPIHRQHAHKSP